MLRAPPAAKHQPSLIPPSSRRRGSTCGFAFRSAFRQRRCLVLADGFFEWAKLGKKKQPYLFRLQGGAPFAFAGLWEHWEKGGRAIASCTVLTAEANALVKPLHERMPVILAPADFERWLDPKAAKGPELQALLAPRACSSQR